MRKEYKKKHGVKARIRQTGGHRGPPHKHKRDGSRPFDWAQDKSLRCAGRWRAPVGMTGIGRRQKGIPLPNAGPEIGGKGSKGTLMPIFFSVMIWSQP